METVSDLVTRIKNGYTRLKENFEMPAAKLSIEVARVLCEEGFLQKYEVVSRGKKRYLRVTLKYALDKYGRPNRSVISGIKKISRSGLRTYVSSDKIPTVQEGFGSAIISTPLGVVPDEVARQKKVGGEVLVYVW